MATRSLGVLTLDLIAKVGGFTGPMDQAARVSQKRAQDIERSMKKASSAIKGVVGALAAGATFNEIIKLTANFENEQAQLAAVLRSTGEAAGYGKTQLNDMATAMSRTSTLTAGDVNEAQTTLLAFTGIVGEEFPRALQAAIDMAARTGMSVVSASETIGRALDVPSKGLASLSKQGFRFTADQKKLAEYLESTGRAAEAQAIILQELESSYGGAAQASRDTLGGALAGLSNQFDELLTSPSGAGAATEAINNLTETLADPRIAAAFGVIVSGVFDVLNAVAEALPNLVGFTTWAAEELAAITVGIHGDDIVRLEKDAEKIRAIMEGGIGNFGERIRLFGPTGLVEFWTKAELDTELGRLDSAIKSYYDAQSSNTKSAESAGNIAHINQEALEAEAAAAAAAAKAKLEADKKELARLKAIKAEAERAEKSRLEGIANEVSAIERAAKIWGMGADQVKVYDLAQKGATQSQLEHVKALLDTVDGFEKNKKAQEDYLQLVKDLRTDEEKLTDQMRERLAVLDAMTGLTDSQRMETAGRVAGAATEAAPEFGGLDASVGGAFGELQKIDEAESKLQDWYATQLDMLETFRAERSDLSATWDEEELALKQEHEDALANIERARQTAQLVATENLFGSLADITGEFAGKQSGIYKAMFLAQKVASIAQAGVAIQTGIALAVASPWPTNLAAMASVAAAAAGLIGNISSINIDGQAHDGIMSIPEDGTWNLKKGERVTTAETSAKLDRKLDRMGGADGVVVNINNAPPGSSAQASEGPNGEQFIDVWIADFTSDGRTAGAVQNKFGLAAQGR